MGAETVSGHIDRYIRAANFLTAAQIFLSENFLIERESNTSFLPEFELSVISKYFPEYYQEIVQIL